MEQPNTNPKGPIDYGKFFEEKKTALDINQPQASQADGTADALPIEKPSFFANIKDSWSFAEKKTKIELIVFVVSLVLTIIFFSLYFAGRSLKPVRLPEGQNVAPPAIDMNIPLPVNP